MRAALSERARKLRLGGTRAIVAALVLLAVVTAAGGALARRSTVVRRATAALFSPAPVSPAPQGGTSGSLAAASPSKEYIYVGGRLVATEESGGGTTPTPDPTFAAPTSLSASPVATAQVGVTWAASGGSVAHYRVERAAGLNAAFAAVGTVAAPSTSYTDTSVTAGTAYLYRVVAVGAAGAASPASNTDLACAVTFADDPLASGVTVIRSYHIGELREAVGAVRQAAGLPIAQWTDPTLLGVPVKAVHLQELRARLDEALAQLGIPTQSYTDPQLAGVPIKRVHIEELRQRVK